MILTGKGASAYKSAGAPLTLTNATTTASADRKKYVISDQAKRFVDTATAVVVERSTDGGSTWTAVSASEFKFAHAGGAVEFAAAQVVGAQIRISGKYLAAAEVAQGKEWSMNITLEFEDTTGFGHDGFKSKTPIINDGNGSITGFFANWDFANALGGTLAFRLKLGDTQSIWFYGILTGDAPALAAQGVAQEQVNLEATGPIYVD